MDYILLGFDDRTKERNNCAAMVLSDGCICPDDINELSNLLTQARSINFIVIICPT